MRYRTRGLAHTPRDLDRTKRRARRLDESSHKEYHSGDDARRRGRRPTGGENHETLARELAASLRALALCREQARAADRRIAVLEGANARLQSELQQLASREAQARSFAYHDELTGLANRRLLQDRLGQALAQSARQGREVALIVLDLDDFKGVNDKLGHPAGDMVLRMVAARITAATRAADTVCRFGGDEFVIMLPELHDRSILDTVVAKLRETLTAPYCVTGWMISMTASMGRVLYPRDADCAAALMGKADQDLYRGKATHRKTVINYNARVTVAAPLTRRCVETGQ